MKADASYHNEASLDGMCRLCLGQCDDENSVDIFDLQDSSLTVRIMACAGLEVCYDYFDQCC